MKMPPIEKMRDYDIHVLKIIKQRDMAGRFQSLLDYCRYLEKKYDVEFDDRGFTINGGGEGS